MMARLSDNARSGRVDHDVPVLDALGVTSDPQEPLPLSYARPQPRAQPQGGFIVALLLCLPGALCWLFLIATISPKWIPTPLGHALGFFIGPWILLCWLIAIATAIASLLNYRKSSKPWYVWINLIINVAGLLFTAVIVLRILMAAWR